MKSFFDLTSNLNEAIDEYSPQALGRKRNMMLRALTLDDSEFERWVHDRVIRFAEQNGIPLQQLDVSAFKRGFSEWQSQLQQSDRQYGEVKDQVSQYVSRFMAVAPSIIARFQSGEQAPVKEPLSPKMVPYEAQGQAQGSEQQPAEGEEQAAGEPQYATSPAPITPEQVEAQQRDAMTVIDLVTNTVNNMGEDERRINTAQFKETVRTLADNIAQANNVDRTQLNYDMIDDYISSMRDVLEVNVSDDMLGIDKEDLDTWETALKKELIDQYGIMEPQREKELRAQAQAEQKIREKAITPKVVKEIEAQDAELGILSALERLTGDSHLTPTAKRKIDSKMSDVHKTYFDIQAESLLEKYPFFKGAKFTHVGRTTGQMTGNWKKFHPDKGAARTPKTDIVATLDENNFVRYDPASSTFIRCSMAEVEDAAQTGCTNTINLSMKKGNSLLMSGRSAESRATFETALMNLTKNGHNFDDVGSLAEYYTNTMGLDEESANQRAEQTVNAVASIRQLSKQFVEGRTTKGQVSMYQPPVGGIGGEYRGSEEPDLKQTQEVIDAAEPFLQQINEAFDSLAENMPELVGEMAYIAASGEGKFEEGTKERATHFLSLSDTDPASGPKIIPIDRQTMYGMVNNGIKSFVSFKSNSLTSVKNKMKPGLRQKGIEAGLEGEELEQYVRSQLDKNVPYTFSTVLRMTMGEIPSTQMESKRYASIRNLLEEKEEEVYDTVQGVSDATRNYTKEAFKWAFSNMDNLTKFFEMQPEVGDVNLPDFSNDFGDTYFKKEMKDELQDLDML